MSGFRGGKMAEAGQMVEHMWTRREAALRATVAHLGLSTDDLWKDSAQRARVVLVHSTRPMAAEEAAEAGRAGSIIPPRDLATVELDGIDVWRGWWAWSGCTATWHEDPLTEWMAAALAPGPEVV